MWETGIQAGASRLDPLKGAEVGGGVCGSDKLRKNTAQSAASSPSPSLFIHPFVTVSGIWGLTLIKSFQKTHHFD